MSMSQNVQEHIDRLIRDGVSRELAEEIARNAEHRIVPRHIATSRDRLLRVARKSKRQARLEMLGVKS